MVKQPHALAAALVMVVSGSMHLAAESRTSVDLSSVLGVTRISGEAVASALTTGKLDISAASNPNVRGELQLRATIGNAAAGSGAAVTVPRAYLKVRLPWFRFMIGKSRVSFGRGFFFDAGDVIFGGAGLAVTDLSASVLRDDTTWLLETYLPLGNFSYLEGVLLPYLGAGGVFGSPASTSLATDLTQVLTPVNWRNLSGGGRAVFRLAGVDMEAGYLFSGTSGVHLPYLAAAGSLGVDWYLAASATVPVSEADWPNLGERLAFSAGLFHLFRLSGDASIAGRIEGLVLPGGSWERASGGITPSTLPAVVVSGGTAAWPSASTVTSTFTSRYGLYLFPELDYSPSQALSLQLRSIVSPIDASATLIAGTGWNVYQGLTLSGYLYAMLGADDATFGWNQPGGIGAAVGAELIF